MEHVLTCCFLPNPMPPGLLCGMGNAACIFMIPFAGCDRALLLASLFLGSIFLGCGSASEVPLASEMSKNFPATIYSAMNMVAMTAGFLAPAFVGFVLDSTPDLVLGWKIVFFFTSGLSVLVTSIFLLFAEAKRQPFDIKRTSSDGEVTPDKKKESDSEIQSEDENQNDPDMLSNHMEIFARRLSQLP